MYNVFDITAVFSWFSITVGLPNDFRDGDTRIACVLHAHLLLMFKNLGRDDVNKTVASVVLSAQVSGTATIPAERAF